MNREDVAIDVTIQDVEILRNRVAELETVAQQVGDLLAVIHRDGGHYQDEHGIAKAIIDAKEVVNQDRIDLNEWQHAAETADSGAKKLPDYAVQLEGKIASKHPEQAGGDERAEFERAFTVQEGIYFDDKRGEYRSMNLCAIEASDAQDLNLQLQGWQARAALAQPSPVRSSLLINGYQLRAALDFIAPDGTAEQLESEACIEWRQQDADFLEAGLYAFCAEYPEEGSVLLDEEPTTAQPSPLQSEQAEAERPEVIRVPSCENSYGFGYVDGSCHVDLRKYRNHLEDILGSLPNDEPLMTVSQHDRIVGELRADRDSWAEQAEQRLADWDEMRKERDAALVRVEQQERTIAGMNEAHAKLAGLYEAAQAQHSVPDGASDLCRFLAKLYCELDGLRYSTAKLPAEQIADALIFKWPVLQGARNQLNIKRISEQPYDESKLHSAIAAMLAAAPGKEEV
ncbi:TPA: hypothetical protein ACLEZY_001095 [Pseudomonas aeruginosa]